MSAINATTGQQIPVVSADQTGFNSMKPEDFMKILIAQLQNQDPTEPMSNEEMLSQISMMRNLQSSLELSSTLKSLGANQGLSSGASFLGKIVLGKNADEQDVSGTVDRVVVREGKVLLGIGEEEVSLDSIAAVGLTQTPAS